MILTLVMEDIFVHKKPQDPKKTNDGNTNVLMLIHVSIYITNNLQSIFLVFKLYDIYPPLYLWAVTYLSPDGPDSSGCHKHRRHIVLLQDPEVDPRVRCPHRFTLNKQGVLHFIFFFKFHKFVFLKYYKYWTGYIHFHV